MPANSSSYLVVVRVPRVERVERRRGWGEGGGNGDGSGGGGVGAGVGGEVEADGFVGGEVTVGDPEGCGEVVVAGGGVGGSL